MELDKVDIEILNILRKNCRTGLSDIARRLNKSVSTISYKINKLQSMGLLKRCVGVVDAKALGYNYHVIIMLRLAPGKLEELEKFVRSRDEIQFVFVITGDYDIALYAVFKDEEHYFDFVASLHKEGLVTETTTFNIIKKIKAELSLV